MESTPNSVNSRTTTGSLEGSETVGDAYDSQRVTDVVFVGGGDAGLLSALLLKKINPDFHIRVIDDFSEDIPEVGKSTISYILHTFHEVLEIDRSRFISEVKPIWKASVYFTDWCGCDPFHVPFDGFSILPDSDEQKFEEMYYRYKSKEYHTIGCEMAESGVTPVVDLSGRGNFTTYDHVAYHLSTNRLNQFLRILCEERGVELIDDRITEVIGGGESIERIDSESNTYDADLYVDATGFKRLLMGKLDNDFITYDFPLNAALVAQADISLSDIDPATVINSGPHGWFWQIDTFDCRDLGYVYSSDYVSKEHAIQEFLDERPEISEDDIKSYQFQAGSFEHAWVGNCVAIGNALGFVEPLQSTAVTTNAELTERLSNLFAEHSRYNHRGIRRIYNSFANTIWRNVYDFVSIHYRYSSGDNEFWEAMQAVNDYENLERYVGSFRENGFNSYEEFDGYGGPTLFIFNQYLFYRVLRSLNVDSDFYESIDVSVDEEIKETVSQRNSDIQRSIKNHLSYEEVYGEDFFG